jgi:nucleoside 2-deoxyribosyltransferase
MWLYFAGRYGRREELKRYAGELRAMGITVTSRWLDGAHEDDNGTPEEAERFAIEDLKDLDVADVLVAFTESPGAVPNRARGGRHVEFGYALAKGKQVCVVGHRENVFCYLPDVGHFKNFEAFKSAVIEQSLPY